MQRIECRTRFLLSKRTVLAVLFLISTIAAARPAQAAGGVSREQIIAVLPEIEKLARQAVDHGDVPGLSIAVVYRDEVVYLQGFGVREAGTAALVDSDTVFQLASCSKPIAATVVAALVGEGRVSWDSRVADIDPGFQMYDHYATAELTLTDLFAHRSGLPGNAGNDLEEIGYGRAEILRRLRLVPPSSSFRAGYSYSNFGLTEGAVAATRAAGTSWEEAAEQELFKPLGMASTSARYGDFLAHANRASLHIPVDGHWVATQQRDADAQSPAGGVSSSARDMAQWVRLQLAGGMLGDRRVVQAAALGRTHKPLMSLGANPVNGQPEFYALGWDVRYTPSGTVWSHSGAFSRGAQTIVTLVPGEQVGIVVLTSAFPTGVPAGLAETFVDLANGRQPAAAELIAAWTRLYRSLTGPAAERSAALYGTPPASPTAALAPSAYAGRYENAYLSAVRVVEANGGLQLMLGPDQGLVRPLAHYDRDLFTMALSPELPDERTAVTFRVAANGRADSVTIEALDESRLGTLIRTGD